MRKDTQTYLLCFHVIHFAQKHMQIQVPCKMQSVQADLRETNGCSLSDVMLISGS
jgi:hypothetical protein